MIKYFGNYELTITDFSFNNSKKKKQLLIEKENKQAF